MAQATVDNALLEDLIAETIMSNPSSTSSSQQQQQQQQLHHMEHLQPQQEFQKFRLDNTETIALGGGFTDLQPDELNPERRVGPVIDIDGGNMRVYCSDTVLRSKKNPSHKTVIRKLNIARSYVKKGGKKGSFRIDVPAHMVKDLAASVQNLGQMINATGKPDFQDYLQLNGPVISASDGIPTPAAAAAATH